MGEIKQAQDNRRVFIDTLNELAEKDPNIILIICDVGFNYLDDPSLKFRVLNLGVTEQSAMIIASALALSGFSVWFYTMINFSLFRPAEMVRNGVVHHNANVKLLGVKGSAGYKFLGFSHNLEHENEDINFCKNIRLDSYVPHSLEEVREVIHKTYNNGKPAYIRL